MVATGTLISGCGLGVGGLGADGLNDAATAGFMAPDGSGDASSSAPEGGGEDAEASSLDNNASPVAESGDEGIAVGADGKANGLDAPDEATDAVIAPDTFAQADAPSGATADAKEAAADGSPDTREAGDATGTDGARGDSATDGNVCMMPAGATTCCGPVACTNHGGSCAAPGICAQCQSTCTNPALPICCALGGTTTKCEARPIDC